MWCVINLCLAYMCIIIQSFSLFMNAWFFTLCCKYVNHPLFFCSWMLIYAGLSSFHSHEYISSLFLFIYVWIPCYLVLFHRCMHIFSLSDHSLSYTWILICFQHIHMYMVIYDSVSSMFVHIKLFNSYVCVVMTLLATDSIYISPHLCVWSCLSIYTHHSYWQYMAVDAENTISIPG